MDKVDLIFKYYEDFGKKSYICEPITQIEHMIQAAMISEKNKESIEIILASLFHDIGHLIAFDKETMGNFGIKNHELLGGQFLRELGMPTIISELVESHVNAKKYLARNPEYFNNLSDASKMTLKYQGGIFNDEESLAFERMPNFEKYIKIRLYDDKAKEINVKLKPLSYYKNLLIDYLSKHNLLDLQ